MAAAREPELAEVFARARPAARQSPDLEVRLRTLVARATSAWPDLSIDPIGLVEAMARALGDDQAEAGLPELYVEDLALALACADGVPNALAECDRLCAGAIAVAVARVDRSPDLRDEVRQILWQRIFVGTAEQPPRIRSYAGRGPLVAWVAVAAQRVALDLRRTAARAPEGDPLVEEVLAAHEHPEIDYLRTRYKPEFEAAVREALVGLTDRDRLLLKLTIVSGLSHEQLANIYGVNQSTVTRWIARAREQVLEATEREVCAKLRMPPGEFRSLAGLLLSRLDLSISRVLDTPRSE
ncbi:MAG TPA: sigma-70 family RNA polymerase sigma factor [Polyangia bacterium]|nr:sigma-70 family RNA polymerase sigma factor [Polyangia bacterium]